MTFAPYSLVELAAYWKRQSGVNLGIVGDTDHATRGVSYHLGKDQLRPGAYSTQTLRDRRGLSNAASAIDLGRLNGGFGDLRTFSDWLARRCVKSFPGTYDVREVIYSPDGKRVLGFKDGIEFLIPDYGDRSHLTHTHISFYRDSEDRSKLGLFKPYFEEDDVSTGHPYDVEEVQGTFTVHGDGHDLLRLDDDRPETRVLDVPAGLAKTVTQRVFLLDQNRAVGYQVRHAGPDGVPRGYFVYERDGVFTEKGGDVKHEVGVTKDGTPVFSMEV